MQPPPPKRKRDPDDVDGDVGADALLRRRKAFKSDPAPDRRALRPNVNIRIPPQSKQPANPSLKPPRPIASGKTASVYRVVCHGRTCAEKKFHGPAHIHDPPLKNAVYRDFYHIERRAYKLLQTIEALDGRVPKFYHKDGESRSIHLEYIQGTPLSKWMDKMPRELSRRCLETLRATLRMLHEAGIAHGDVCPGNILIRRSKDGVSPVAVLIDFRHATFQDHRQFESRCPMDNQELGAIFYRIMAKENTRDALALLRKYPINPTPHEQLELARHVKHSWPDDTIIHSIQAIARPAPALLLALARSMHPYNPSFALRICSEYKPEEDSPGPRSTIMLQGDHVLWSKKVDMNGLADITNRSSAELGCTDPYILHCLKHVYAVHLERDERKPEAYQVWSTMLHDLEHARRPEEDADEEKAEHLFKPELRRQDWISRAKESLVRLGSEGSTSLGAIGY